MCFVDVWIGDCDLCVVGDLSEGCCFWLGGLGGVGSVEEDVMWFDCVCEIVVVGDEDCVVGVGIFVGWWVFVVFFEIVSIGIESVV